MLTDRLTDYQLYALVINQDLDPDLHEQVHAEFKKRNFSQEHIDQLAIEYEKVIPSINDDLTTWQKIRIIAFPFFIPIQAIIANRYISKGNIRKWKQYWKFLTVGLLVWTIVILVLVKLFYKDLKS
jgi:hypothetical protein